MKNLALALALLVMASLLPGLAVAAPERTAIMAAGTLAWSPDLPVYDHIVIVIEENKDYEEIIGNAWAPYINNVLRQEGANFTRMFAEEHLSEGNYFWLFSGDNQGIGFDDAIPSAANNPRYPFTAPNLGAQLIARGLSFKGYSESLPSIGYTGGGSGLYARKHVPWISFANVPNGQTVDDSSNLRFVDFPTGPDQYHTLPTVAIVVPNLVNDMHDGPNDQSIPAGERWLIEHIDPYYQWAKTHNSLLILTFDENHDRLGYRGLTNPLADPAHCAETGRDPVYCHDLQNRIVTIFAGAHIKPGDYAEGQGITHVNILRTLEAMYGLPKAGLQQVNASTAGITDDYLITDIFMNYTSAHVRPGDYAEGQAQ